MDRGKLDLAISILWMASGLIDGALYIKGGAIIDLLASVTDILLSVLYFNKWYVKDE